MDQTLYLKDQDFSFFGRGSSIKGQFTLTGPTHLSSKVEGDIVMQDQAWLCIQKHGLVEGKISGHDIEVYGHVKGHIEATGKVTIYPPAIVEGEIHSTGLVVHPGARIDSEIHSGA